MDKYGKIGNYEMVGPCYLLLLIMLKIKTKKSVKYVYLQNRLCHIIKCHFLLNTTF